MADCQVGEYRTQGRANLKLAANHDPSNKLLQGDEETANIAPWVLQHLAGVLWFICLPTDMAGHTEPVNREYFLKNKYGNDLDQYKRDAAVLSDPAKYGPRVTKARAVIRQFEQLLQSRPGKFILSDQVSHADSIVFGWYLASAIHPTLNDKIWEGDNDTPRVSAWIKAMGEITGLKPHPPTL